MNLTEQQTGRLAKAMEDRARADALCRAEVLAVMAEGGSFAAVAEATGLSTNTLQRWKREAANR